MPIGASCLPAIFGPRDRLAKVLLLVKAVPRLRAVVGVSENGFVSAGAIVAPRQTNQLQLPARQLEGQIPAQLEIGALLLLAIAAAAVYAARQFAFVIQLIAEPIVSLAAAKVDQGVVAGIDLCCQRDLGLIEVGGDHIVTTLNQAAIGPLDQCFTPGPAAAGKVGQTNRILNPPGFAAERAFEPVEQRIGKMGALRSDRQSCR